MANKAIFLDRDDTLVDDPGYIKSPEQIKLLPGAADALIQLKKMGYLLVIVTNQSAIARGYINERQLDEIHRQLKSLLSADGATVDGLYYCPYHPDGVVKDFSMESNLRKPDSGMLELAAEEMDIDLERSWMIGDSYRDIKAGKKVGCQTILVDVPGKNREKQPEDPDPDRKAVNLREAVNIVRMYEFHQKAKTARKTLNKTPLKTPKPAKDTTKIEDTVKAAAETAQTQTTAKAVVKEAPAKSEPAAAKTFTPDKPEKPEKSEKAEKPTEPMKLHTTKRVAVKEPATQPEPPEKTHHLLEEILHRVTSQSRSELYDDFSVFKLLAVMTQVIALTCIVVSLVFWLSKNPNLDKVQIMLSYGIAMQLVVISLLMMHKRD